MNVMRMSMHIGVAVACVVLVCAGGHARSKYARPGKTTATVASREATADETPAGPVMQSVEYERVLSRHNDALIEDHLWYFTGLAHLAKGRADKAAAVLGDLVAIHPESVWVPQARLRLAEALINVQRYDEASALIDAILRHPPNRYDAFEAKLLKARALAGARRCGEAEAQFKFVAQSAAEDAELGEVTRHFGDLRRACGVNLDGWIDDPAVQYRIAESYFEFSQWDEAAVRVHGHVLNAHPSPELRRRAEYLHARALARTHHYAEAIALFEKLGREGGEVPGLTYWLARTYAKQNEFEKAIALRRKMVKRYGASRSSASFLAKIAFLRLDQGLYDQARDEWLQVIALRPAGREMMQAKWYLAWCEYRLKDYDAAVATFDWMLANGAKRYGFDERVRYWKARALIDAGRGGEGMALLRQLTGRSGYYGELASRRLRGDRRTVRDFGRTGRHGGGGSAITPHVPSAEAIAGASVHLARAIRLVEIGLPDLAAREVRAAAEGQSGIDPLMLMEVARRSGAHDVGRRLAVTRFSPVLKGSPDGARERYIWQMAYPQAYPHVVAAETKGSPIDGDLVWSIMKAESNFRPEVVSPAGAIGLMQLMPSTARSLSEDRGMSDSRRLFEPETNIEFGVRYVKGRIQPLFPDDIVAIIASYNAGEEAVARWIRNKPKRDDIEMFVEEIPYDETCLYVKRVLTNYWTMKRLYE